jgi:hypothetical protein
MASIKEIADMKAHEWGLPNDHALKERIKLLVVPMRATIIQRRYDQTKRFPVSMVQTLHCSDLIWDECIKGEIGMPLKRTREKIPLPLIVRDESEYIYVGQKNMLYPFDRKDIFNLNLQKHKRWSGKRPFYFVSDEYIWVGNAPNLKVVSISGVFDDPIKLASLGDVEGSCYLDGDFQIEHSLLNGVLALIEEKRVRLITPELNTEVEVTT